MMQIFFSVQLFCKMKLIKHYWKNYRQDDKMLYHSSGYIVLTKCINLHVLTL